MAGCRSCGGGGGKPKITVGTSRIPRKSAQEESQMVLIEYIGPATQFQRVKSRVKASVKYRFGGNPGADSRKFFAYKSDAEWLSQNQNFRRAKQEPTTSVVADVPVLEAHTRPAPVKLDDFIAAPSVEDIFVQTPATRLNLAPEVVSILETAGLLTVEQIEPLSIAQLVVIKGIGPRRAAQIIEAVKELKG